MFRALGVKGTPVFLGLETRRGTVATRQQSYHGIQARRGQIFENCSRDDDTASSIARGRTGEELAPLESLRCVWLRLDWIGHLQDIYLRFPAGTIAREVRDAEQPVLGSVVPQPGFGSWRGEVFQFYAPEFVAAVKAVETVDLVVFDRESRKWVRPGGTYKP